MRRLLIAAALAAASLQATPALAHVTVQPPEAVAGSFARFSVRVPNERPDASTVKVQLQLPPLAFVSFEDAPGWDRRVRNVTFDEPLEAFGQELTEGVGTVTWSGGRVEPGEFTEFGFSAAMPEGTQDLEFKAIQTYSSGEVVRWTGAPDSEEPAPHVRTYDIGAGEGQGQLAVLARLVEEVDAMGHPSAASDEGSDDGSQTVPLLLGGAGLAAGLSALLVALSARRAG